MLDFPHGFYRGSPIPWMPGWEGKLFDASARTGVNVWKGGRKWLTFRMEIRKDRIWIIYPCLPVHDEIIATETGYSGEIFVFGKKVGEFRLWK